MNKVIVRTETFRSHFLPILNKWADIIEQYTNNYNNDDALYWYNERATLSTLAGAIWKENQNNFVLEEFRIDKESKRDCSYPGRADMYFVCGRSEYIVEAKQIWVSISDRADSTTDKINKSLRDARRDSTKSKSDGEKVLGIVFVVPYISESEQKRKDDLIKTFIKELRDVDCEILAYTFPDKANVKSDDGYLYPGVACCMRRPNIRRPKK